MNSIAGADVEGGEVSRSRKDWDWVRGYRGSSRQMTPPNKRLKLSGCGARLKGNGSLLIAAAAPRSLSAIRSAPTTLWPSTIK